MKDKYSFADLVEITAKLRSPEGCPWDREQTLHYRVICQVDKHGHMLRYTALFKRPTEEISHIVLHAHSSEHNGELLIGIVPQGCLLDNLGGQLVVGKAVS